MPFYRIVDGKAEIGNVSHGADWIEYQVGSEPAELKVILDAENEVKMIAHFKGLYLGKVQEVLNSKDYDSLATVKLWEGDATYGAEATGIITWYKSVIAYNYQLLADVKAGTVPIPDDATYLAGIPAYV